MLNFTVYKGFHIVSLFLPGLLFLLVGFMPASAVSGEVSLSSAYQMALENNEAIAIAVEDLFQSERDVGRAYSLVLPSVTANASHRRYNDAKKTSAGTLLQPDYGNSIEVKIEQLVFGGGREVSGIRQARLTARGNLKAVDFAREEVLIETARAYYGALKSAKEVDINRASLKRAAEQQRVSEARLRAGTATKSVVLRAEAEVAGSSAELVSSENDYKNSIVRLKRIAGIEGPLELMDPPDGPPPALGLEELVKNAFSRRRDYLTAKIDEDVAREGVKYARGKFLPRVTLDGVYTYRDQEPETAFLLNDVVYADAKLSYPIFEGGLRVAELRQARSEVREAELERLSLKRDIEIEVREAYNNVAAYEAVADSFEKQLAFAKENYDMVFKQFTFGLADNMDLIDADTTLVEAERGLSNARLDYQLALLELKKSVGLLLDEVTAEAAR